MRISDWSSDVCSSDLSVSASTLDAVVIGCSCRGAHASAAPPSSLTLSPTLRICRLMSQNSGLAMARHPMEIHVGRQRTVRRPGGRPLRSEEQTSELQSLMRISYAVFCLKKKKINKH